MAGPGGVVPSEFSSDELVARLLAQESVLAWIADWTEVERSLRARGITSTGRLEDALGSPTIGWIAELPFPKVLAASPATLELMGAADIHALTERLQKWGFEDLGEVLHAFMAGTAQPKHQLVVRTQSGRRRLLYDWLYAPRFGGSAYAFAVGFDVTQGAEALTALAASEERYRRVVEDQTELIVRYGPGGVRTFVNDAYCRYFAASREALVGTSFFDLVAEEHLPRIKEKLEAITPDHPVRIEEHRVVAPDGAERWQEWIDRGIFDREQRLVEYQAVGRDVTDRVLARQQLRAALEEVERLRDRLAAENSYLRGRIRTLEGPSELIGESAPVEQLRIEIGRVAPTDATVLIRGETGVGKELVVDALHAQSRRADRALIKINCAAISGELVESELFGHMKGAFTSAVADREGSFSAADGGTLFLDEIAELPPSTQAKLLRVLQNGEIQPVGSTKTRIVDVRIVAATNRNLEEAVIDGSFRRDLYYRIAVFPIDVPPLRTRGEDVLRIAEAFARRAALRHGKPFDRLTGDACARLLAHDWPGNIRELSNVIERAIIVSTTGTIAAADLAIVMLQKAKEAAPPTAGGDQTLDEVMREYIIHVLGSRQWQIGGPKGAAATLGLNESTLRARMRKLGIERPR